MEIREDLRPRTVNLTFTLDSHLPSTN